jgi:hypothetical protein
MPLFHRSATTRAALLIMGLSALALTQGCKPKPAVDNSQNEVTPVILPPSISASSIYRCKDDSLISVDFFADGLTANLRTTKDGPIHHLAAAASGQPFDGDGYSLSGSGKTVQLTTPTSPVQSCKS